MGPQTQKQWVIRGSNGFGSLEFQPDAPVPSIGDREVLVRCMSSSMPLYLCHG